MEIGEVSIHTASPSCRPSQRSPDPLPRWADLYSFVTRMKEEAIKRGVDLLLVDSGDRVDGNGLVDADPVLSGSALLSPALGTAHR